MAITAHVHQIYIKATPEHVWTALTDSDWTRRYLHGTSFVEPPAPGRPYRTVTADGRPAVEGVIEEMVPPTQVEPGRLVQTWRVLYDAAMAEEPPSTRPRGQGTRRPSSSGSGSVIRFQDRVGWYMVLA